MKHLNEAEKAMGNSSHIKVAGQNVVFTIQDGPIGEVGENGCQATDVLQFVNELFISLNNSFPCEENEATIKHIGEAVAWQESRTANRTKRGVEGQNKA